jgi:CDP-diacylglycerol--glycerol-3-phosphate 3-phosphatidyltransferase
MRPPDLREILPEMAAIVRGSCFKPWGFVRALDLGIRRGLAESARYPGLRASYGRCLAAVGLVNALQAVALLLVSEVGPVAVPLAVSAFWFFAGGFIVYSQISLVKRPGGKVNDRFGFPNTLTLYRFLNIPFLVALLPLLQSNRGLLLVGTVVFVMTAVTDVIDGNYARLTGQVTEFGRIYDPVCDIGINSGVCLGAWGAGFVPLWYMLLAQTRFFLPIVGGVWTYTSGLSWKVKPTPMGRVTVFIYDVYIGLLLLRELTGLSTLGGLTEAFFWFSVFAFSLNILTIVDRGIRLMLRTARERGGLHG